LTDENNCIFLRNNIEDNENNILNDNNNVVNKKFTLGIETKKNKLDDIKNLERLCFGFITKNKLTLLIMYYIIMVPKIIK